MNGLNRAIWVPPKIDPMAGKIPGAGAEAYNQRGHINTLPQRKKISLWS